MVNCRGERLPGRSGRCPITPDKRQISGKYRRPCRSVTPVFRRKHEREQGSDPSFDVAALGWIETVRDGPREGAWGIPGPSDQRLIFRDETGLELIDWSAVNWVKREPRSWLRAGPRELHAELLAKAPDGDLLLGFLNDGFSGVPGSGRYAIVPGTPDDVDVWMEAFRAAGVRELWKSRANRTKLGELTGCPRPPGRRHGCRDNRATE